MTNQKNNNTRRDLMKKMIIGAFMLLMVATLVGCGVKEKIQKKAGEALTEKVLEGAGAGDVDIDGDTITFTGEDGAETTFGETEWPTSDLAKEIPEFKEGKVVTVMEMNDTLFVTVEEAPKKDFDDYLDKIKENFTQDSYDMKSEDAISYSAQNEEGVGVSVVYTSDEVLNITVTKTAQ